MLSMRILFSRKNLQVLSSIVLFQTSQTILEQNQLQKNKFSFFLILGKDGSTIKYRHSVLQLSLLQKHRDWQYLDFRESFGSTLFLVIDKSRIEGAIYIETCDDFPSESLMNSNANAIAKYGRYYDIWTNKQRIFYALIGFVTIVCKE